MFVDLFNVSIFLIPATVIRTHGVKVEHLSGSAIRDMEELSKRMKGLKTMGVPIMEQAQCNSPELLGTSI